MTLVCAYAFDESSTSVFSCSNEVSGYRLWVMTDDSESSPLSGYILWKNIGSPKLQYRCGNYGSAYFSVSILEING